MEHLVYRDTKSDYEFNEGENLILQMLTDEMRMAGYNQLQYAAAAILMGAHSCWPAPYVHTGANSLLC